MPISPDQLQGLFPNNKPMASYGALGSETSMQIPREFLEHFAKLVGLHPAEQELLKTALVTVNLYIPDGTEVVPYDLSEAKDLVGEFPPETARVIVDGIAPILVRSSIGGFANCATDTEEARDLLTTARYLDHVMKSSGLLR